MNIVTIDLDKLRDAERNANRMEKDAFERLKVSIQTIGFVQPIYVRALPDGTFEVIDGHHRSRAMRELGHRSISAVVEDPTNPRDPRLVALALNRLRGETDLAAAGLMIQDLLDDAHSMDDLAITGFSESEIGDLIKALMPSDPTADDLGDVELPQDPEESVDRPFMLELSFKRKEDISAAKRALRKAAGKGNDLADGLLRLISGE